MNPKHLKQQLDKFHIKDNIYLGTVISKRDPLKLNRVQVSVDDKTDKIPEDSLPWYVVIKSPDASSNSQTSLPREGSRVFVEFPNDDIYNGVVKSTVSSIPAKANNNGGQ